MDTGFFPDFCRAQAMLGVMNSELAKSLSHIRGAASDAGLTLAAPLDNVVDFLSRGGRVSPEDFAHYYQLADAAFAADNELMSGAVERLTRFKEVGSDLRVVRFSDSAADEISQAFSSQIDCKESGITVASAADFAWFEQKIKAGFDALGEVHVNLAKEIRALVNTVLVAAPTPDDSPITFDGGSIFSMPGLLFLNIERHQTRLEMMEVLTHEAAHSLLFGFCIDTPLTLNPEDNLYTSPLRADPRPMEGIYHAMYVSARMCLVMDHAARSDFLTQDEREKALELAEHDARNFEAGYSVVDAEGVLTGVGSNLLRGAKSYMGSRKSA